MKETEDSDWGRRPLLHNHPWGEEKCGDNYHSSWVGIRVACELSSGKQRGYAEKTNSVSYLFLCAESAEGLTLVS
jgi:hypothetical protein